MTNRAGPPFGRLVDEGTYVVGKRKNFADTEGPFADTGIIFEPDYQSLDKVMNPGHRRVLQQQATAAGHACWPGNTGC